MHTALRLVLILAVFSLMPLPHLQASEPHWRPASQRDRHQLVLASRLALRDPSAAMRWLRGRPEVSRVVLGPDGKTVNVLFTDGADVEIVPREGRSSHAPTLAPLVRTLSHVAINSSSPRAIVLEPFANQLGFGASAGQAEADALTAAGFQVNVLRNTAVTVAVLESLASYAVVYVESHSYVAPSGDALLTADETDAGRYLGLYEEGSLIQVYIAGDGSGTLYNAVDAKFVSDHMGVFPDNSIVYLNGCSVLRGNVFWTALRGKNVATLMSWDNEVFSDMSEVSGQMVVNRLAQGDTVADSVLEAGREGLATSTVNGVIAHLGFLGDGSDTLVRAGGKVAPRETPTATETPVTTQAAPATPTPTATTTPSPTAKPRPPTKTKTVKSDPRAQPGIRKEKCKSGWHLVHGKCKKVKPRCKRKHCK